MISSKFLLYIIFAVSAYACVGCIPAPAPNPPTPDADASPALVEDAGAPMVEAAPLTSCGAACAVLGALGCPEGRTTPRGLTCESVCTTAQRQPGIDLPLSCVRHARSVTEVRACGVRCPGV